jgi:hypothetical protein
VTTVDHRSSPASAFRDRTPAEHLRQWHALLSEFCPRGVRPEVIFALRDRIRSERGVVSVSPEEVRRVLASKLARGSKA